MENDFDQFLDRATELNSLLNARMTGGRLVGRTGKVMDNFGGVSTLNNLRILFRLIQQHKPMRTLEIGVGYGASCLLFAYFHKFVGHHGLSPKPNVSIDPTIKTHWDDVIGLALARADLTDFVDLREEYSMLGLADLYRERQRFDIAYIDGSHKFEDVFVDFYFVSKLMNPGGIVLFDDSSTSAVRRVLKLVRDEFPERFAPIDLLPYRQDVGLAAIKYRVARALGKAQMTAFARTTADINGR